MNARGHGCAHHHVDRQWNVFQREKPTSLFLFLFLLQPWWLIGRSYVVINSTINSFIVEFL
jgi:hypothetical protein